MADEKPLTELDQGDLDEDPLIFLSCGHIFPMSSVDGHTELDKCYSKSAAGTWEKPLPLEVPYRVTCTLSMNRDRPYQCSQTLIARLACRSSKLARVTSTPSSGQLWEVPVPISRYEMMGFYCILVSMSKAMQSSCPLWYVFT